MACVLVSCLACGDREVESEDVTLRVCSSDMAGSYSFECPSCHRIVVEPASRRKVQLLVTAGIREVTWHNPGVSDELHGCPPLNDEDLKAFHTLLQGDDWLDQLRGFTAD